MSVKNLLNHHGEGCKACATKTGGLWSSCTTPSSIAINNRASKEDIKDMKEGIEHDS